jgi:cytochrome o ubiquinol oxidase operon protein cyoD
MSKSTSPVVSHHSSEEHGSLRTYVTGFILSIVFTLTAYLLVSHHAFSNLDLIVAAIVGLALIQFVVQLFFFLHLGKETKPRWKLFVLIFMVTVVLILVFGSIWIIGSLNNRMSIPQQEEYMNNQGGGF